MSRSGWRRVVALWCVLVMGLTACSPERVTQEQPGEDDSAQSSALAEGQAETIPFTLAAYPAYSFHPALAGNKINLMLAPLMYEGLYAVDGSFQAQKVLCQSEKVSEDGLTWSFTLKSGITFSDGTSLTAELAAEALKTAMGQNSRYAARLADVSQVAARDGAVVVTLRRPNASLPLLLDVPIALGEGDRPLGTGPYVLHQKGEDSYVLQARADWWQGGQSLPIQEIPLETMTQTDELIAAFDAGDIALLDVDLMGTNALGYSGSYEVWDYSTPDMVYLGFNTQRGICRSSALRRAMAQAVDRDGIAESTYARHAVAASLPVHPASDWYDSQLARELAYDPEGLVQILEQQKLKDKSLTLLVNSENSAKVAAAQRIAYQLEAAGLKVTVDKQAWEDYLSALSRGDFDLYIGEVLLTADFDLSALITPGGTLNYSGWQDWSVTALLSAFRGAAGEEKRAAADVLYRYLNQEVPFTAICFKNGSVLTQWGRLTGLQPVQNNVFFHLEEWSIQ